MTELPVLQTGILTKCQFALSSSIADWFCTVNNGSASFGKCQLQVVACVIFLASKHVLNETESVGSNNKPLKPVHLYKLFAFKM